MNERINVNDVLEGLAEANAIDEYGNAGVRIEACIRQQQAEIEALKLQLHTTLTNRDLRTYDGKDK